MGSLRILIACPDDKLRLALIMFLYDHRRSVVASITDRLTGLAAKVESSDADVLLLDWAFPAHSLADALASVKDLERQPKIIVLSAMAEDEEVIREAGADYYIVKSAPPDKLIPVLDAIRSTMNEEVQA